MLGCWRWGLAKMGRERGLTFRIYQRNGCGLFTRNWLHLVASHRRPAIEHVLTILPTLSPGTYVGMSCSRFSHQQVLPSILRNTTESLRALGLKPFGLSHTPGQAASAERYFACSEASWMPLTKVPFAAARTRARGTGDDEWAFNCVPGLLGEGYFIMLLVLLFGSPLLWK